MNILLSVSERQKENFVYSAIIINWIIIQIIIINVLQVSSFYLFASKEKL